MCAGISAKNNKQTVRSRLDQRAEIDRWIDLHSKYSSIKPLGCRRSNADSSRTQLEGASVRSMTARAFNEHLRRAHNAARRRRLIIMDDFLCSPCSANGVVDVKLMLIKAANSPSSNSCRCRLKSEHLRNCTESVDSFGMQRCPCIRYLPR